MSTVAIYPLQKISKVEKLANDKQFYKDSADYYIDLATTYSYDRQEILSLYNLLGTSVNLEDYKHVINPFNIKDENFKRYPAKLRNYNILKPIVDLFLGERTTRLDNFTVLTTQNEENAYQANLNKAMIAYTAQQVVNNLNQIGVETGVDSKEVPPIEEFKADFELNYGENQSLFGQEALDYIIYDQDLDDKAQLMILDYLISGRVYTRRSISHNDVHYEVLSSLFSYHPELEVYEQVEDKDWFVYENKLTPNQVVDTYRKKLKPEDIDKLETMQGAISSLGAGAAVWMSNETDLKKSGISSYYAPGTTSVWELEFKGFKQIGILSYQDELGQMKTMEVTEDYFLLPEIGDINIEEEWISCLYNVVRIDFDDNTHTYLDLDEVEIDRASLNNSSEVKLSFNGIINSTRTGEVLSLARIAEPYQILTNILFYQLEKLINKNKSGLTVLPISLFPNHHPEWGQDKFLWASEALDLLVVDDTRRSAAASLNAIKRLDVSTREHIVGLFDVVTRLKMDFWDSIGMNRQRYGDIKTSAGKATTEQAVFRSALITEETYRRIEKLLEKDYEALLDYSKAAWLNGKKGMYVNSQGRISYLQLNQDNIINHIGRDYRVFIKNSATEREKLEYIKQMIFPAAQNGADFAIQFALLEARNSAQAKKSVLDAQKAAREFAASLKEQEAQIEQAKLGAEVKKLEQEKYKTDMSYKEAIDSVMLKGEIDAQLAGKELELDWENLRLNWGELRLKETLGLKEIASKERIAEKSAQNRKTNNK